MSLACSKLRRDTEQQLSKGSEISILPDLTLHHMMCQFDKLGRSTVLDTTESIPNIGKFSFSTPEILNLLSGAVDVKPANLLASLSNPH